MNPVEKQLKRLYTLQQQANEINKQLNDKLAEHIGEDYFLQYQPGDGWLIVCSETANQAKLGFLGCKFSELFEMSSEAAKSVIDDCKFN